MQIKGHICFKFLYNKQGDIDTPAQVIGVFGASGSNHRVPYQGQGTFGQATDGIQEQ